MATDEGAGSGGATGGGGGAAGLVHATNRPSDKPQVETRRVPARRRCEADEGARMMGPGGRVRRSRRGDGAYSFTMSTRAALLFSLGLGLFACGEDEGRPASPGASRAGAGGSSEGGAAGTISSAGGASGFVSTGGTAGTAGSAGMGGQGGSAVGGAWSFVVIETRSITSLEQQAQVELVRATKPDGTSSYLLYVPALANPAIPKPALVIQNEPYAGIDWTGEEVDQRWAKQGLGVFPDVDAPDYDGNDVIGFTPQSVQQAVDSDVVWRLNGHATVHAYARFYAGGDVAGDVSDAAAAYHFALSRKDTLDLSRIGALGGSWGGMMTLFGARAAPPGAQPIALAALTPLSDFVDEWAWTQVEMPKSYRAPGDVDAFFSPYWRRAKPSMGNPPAGPASAPFTHQGLCPGLPGKVFAPQDDWDTLIPVRQTEQLVKACGASIEPLYWRRAPIDYQTVALDHGILGAEGKAPSVFTFGWTFLATALAAPGTTPIATAGDRVALTMFLTTVREAQKSKRDPGAVLPRLRELAAPRVTVFESTAQAFVPGADVVAEAVNAVWGTQYDGPGVRKALEKGLPQ